LIGDLRHVIEASGCGAIIERAAVPVGDWIASRGEYDYALEAGDDYEICCTLRERHRGEVERWNRDHPDCRLSMIGKVTESDYVLQAGNRSIDLDSHRGFNHFE